MGGHYTPPGPPLGAAPVFLFLKAVLARAVFLVTPLPSALAPLPTLARLLVVVALGEVGHAPTKLAEVHLAIVVFVQHLHGLLDVVCTDFILQKITLVQHETYTRSLKESEYGYCCFK